MNIFILDENMEKSAQYHCDKHCSKMILEMTQLLCTAAVIAGNNREDLYRVTHKNHPCSIWVRASLSNWLWTKQFIATLNEEYKFRYGRDHKSAILASTIEIPNIPDIGLTDFARAMPKEYQGLSAIEDYRLYYCAEKAHLMQYKHRELPDWYTGEYMSIWSKEMSDKAIELYTDAEPTAETSLQVAKEVAEEVGVTVNSLRMKLVKAGVWVKAATGSESKSTTEKKTTGKRVDKGAAVEELKRVILASGGEVDEAIVDKLTGKAAVYWTGLLSRLAE